MEEKEKVYTLKSVQSELNKLKKSRDKKKEQIQKLTSEMKADNKRIKELESIHDTLYHEDLQRQIATVWFKEQKMTGKQIEKFLQISSQVHEQIDILDVNVIVQAITQLGDKQQLLQGSASGSDDAAVNSGTASSTYGGATYSTSAQMGGSADGRSE